MSRRLRDTYRVPAAIAVASVVGLLSALMADGLWDGLSWFGLGAAVAVGSWCALRRSS